MLKLEAPAREPYWLDILPGVRVKVRPVSVADILIARATAADALKISDDPKPGGSPDRDGSVAAGASFTRSLARTGIVGWEGVGDAGGKAVEPNPETIDQLLELWPAFDAIDRLYVGPALTRIEEKNV